MGYHHDHELLQDAAESLCDQEGLRGAERHELQPLEVRRMIRKVATLVQLKHPLRDPVQGAIPLEGAMEAHQIRAPLPDTTMPLLCVGVGREGAVSDSALQLAEHLLSLGYGHVFYLASGSQELSTEGR